ncbi:MAG: GntR family transcriptional regulator [Victivallaceae bacterium]|nr:GntR family transcriptional regulator [Victivallaceae bacterium]
MKKTLLIRHYVIAQMYRAGNSSVQIMSARELAKHFDIAQSTVSLALKELTQEGYLFSRPGIGSFTNPIRMAIYQDRAMPPLIGVMGGDGRFFYMGADFWKTFRSIGDMIFAEGWNMRSIELTGPLSAETAQEIFDNQINALIWVGAYRQTDFTEALKKFGIPVIADSPFLPDVNTVTPCLQKPLESLFDYICTHDFHSVLLWLPPEISDQEVPILRKMAEEKKYPLEIEILNPEHGLPETFWKNFCNSHARSLVVGDAVRCSAHLLKRYTGKFASQIEAFRHLSAVQNGVPYLFLKGHSSPGR